MLVEITEKTYPVTIELLYGTDQNFTGKKIYQKSICLFHEKAIPLLERSIVRAEQLGFKLKIFDAFRPHQAQEILWNHTPNPNYIMPPTKGSVHTRGIAIDLTLLDKHGQELDMHTPFDDFTTDSHHSAIISKQAAENRYLLLGIMMSSGWDFFDNEWWHYQLFNPKDYPLITDDYGIMS